ncbi:MAG: amidohydrolase family protein [Flavisolibacter sp.]
MIYLSSMKTSLLFWALFFAPFVYGQTDSFFLLKPDKIFDGTTLHEGWVILTKNNRIAAAGPLNFSIPANTRIVELKGATILPGLIEGHSHLFLHPYNEVSWNDQVLKESRAERMARAVVHAKMTLWAGFTTVRDLGTEGSFYDDVGLKQAIAKGIIVGPRMIVATRAIVAKGAYGPNFGNPDVDLPQGAAEVGNTGELEKEIRTQISKGADLIKIYADYRWGKNGEALPTFSSAQLAHAVQIAKSAGRQVVVHATTAEGMKRAIDAGVATIEHGDQGTLEVFKLMKEKAVALCPTLAAGSAMAQYQGWKKEGEPAPKAIVDKQNSFRQALAAGVTICMGGDVGVFPHGDNAREMELMVEYGMTPLEVLKSATSINAAVFGYGDLLGSLKNGMLADMIAVQGDPSVDIKKIKKMIFIMKDGIIYLEPSR